MTHARSRALFAAALFVCGVTLASAAAAALMPKPVPYAIETDITLASLSQLRDLSPSLVVIPGLNDLEFKAQDARGWRWTVGGVVHRSMSAGLPVYVVRDGDDVRAFIAIDPRNGCDLRVISNAYSSAHWPVLFDDVCHGALYGLAGEHVGGPSPFTLDQLVVTIRGERVFASRTDVIAGHWIYPR